MRPSSPLPAGTGAAFVRRATPEPEREVPRDPVDYVQGELDEHLWSKQREIAGSVERHRRTMVPACFGPGKSFVASRLMAWWGQTREDPFIVTSAPTDDQVKGILWREFSRAHAKGGLPGRVAGARWHVGPRSAPQLIAWGRKPQDLVDAGEAMAAFQGIHSLNVLVVLDEAAGVPPWLWDAADGLLTNENARLLAIGNPADAASRFAEECQPGSGANVIRIDAFDTPNFTGEWVPEHLRMLLTSRTWVEERRARWGEDNPLWQSKVRARFPDTSDDKVISPAMVRAAQALDLPGDEQGSYGLDVARFGADKTVLYRVRGGVARLVAEWHKQSTDKTADKVEALTRRTPDVAVAVDAEGLGGAVYDFLVAGRNAGGRRVRAVPFTTQTPVRNPRRFHDRRSEMWWSYRERMEDGLVDLDPGDDDLAAQLQQPKWWLDARGRIQIETKKEMAKRGLPSPDRADAVIMAEEHAPPPLRPRDVARERRAAERGRSVTADLLKRPM